MFSNNSKRFLYVNELCLSLYTKITSLRIEQYMKKFHSSADKPPKADIAGLIYGFIYYPQPHKQ
jgi:hypothetical protein